jgi:hypothetical protein
MPDWTSHSTARWATASEFDVPGARCGATGSRSRGSPGQQRCVCPRLVARPLEPVSGSTKSPCRMKGAAEAVESDELCEVGDRCRGGLSGSPPRVVRRARAPVRSGCVAAKRAHRQPASDHPKSEGRSTSISSTTTRRSSCRTSSGGGSLGENRSERPVPRRSMRVSRENEARRRRNRVYGGYSQARSRLLKNPETNATSMDRPPRPDGRERYRRFL